MRVVVFGGRNYQNYLLVFDVLTHLHKQMGIERIIEGGASGADNFAKAWSIAADVPATTEFALWDHLDVPGAVIKVNKFGRKYNVMAGFQRNQRMLDLHRPDLAVAFPGGKGTRDMRTRVEEAGVRLIEVYADPLTVLQSGERRDEEAYQRQIQSRRQAYTESQG